MTNCAAQDCADATWIGTDFCKPHLITAARSIAMAKIGEGREASMQYLRDMKSEGAQMSKRLKRKIRKALKQ